MRLVFWQNMLSHLQLPYIVHLLDDNRIDEVVIVAEVAVSTDRRSMGWQTVDIPGLDCCKVYLNPMTPTIKQLLSERTDDSVHLFSGIRGFRFVFQCFQLSLNYPVKRSLIMERPITLWYGITNGKPLWLHRLKALMQDRRYWPSFQSVFAMGKDAVDYYQSLHSAWQVFPFAYCVSSTPIKAQPVGSINYLFVGSLSLRKAPADILNASLININKYKSRGENLNFVGDGAERAKLEKIIATHRMQHVKLWGTQPNNEIPTLMAKYDVLILPSIHDGWGAVVNEALTQGLFVICSDKCGAKELLNDERCGMVYTSKKISQLAKAMHDCETKIDWIRSTRAFRKEWAATRISGKVIAKYMIDCLNNANNKVPWLV